MEFRNRSLALSLPLVLLALLLAPATSVWAAESAAGGADSFSWRAFLAPFHSVVLHLPIGFITIALLLEIYAFFDRGRSLRRGIGIVLWAGALSAIASSAFGIFRASGGGYEKTTLTLHQWSGIVVTVLIVVLAIVHLFAFPKEKRRLFAAGFYRFGLFIGLGLLGFAGHYGGNLTHGSKYLFENAPEWVRTWAEETEAKLVETVFGEDAVAESGERETGEGYYADTIRPIFEEKCFSCHGTEKQKADYRMDTIEGLFAAGESEIDPIVPGRPLESYLVELITLPEEDDYVMPPSGKESLTPEETLTVIRWIWDGAETGAREVANR